MRKQKKCVRCKVLVSSLAWHRSCCLLFVLLVTDTQVLLSCTCVLLSTSELNINQRDFHVLLWLQMTPAIKQYRDYGACQTGEWTQGSGVSFTGLLICDLISIWISHISVSLRPPVRTLHLLSIRFYVVEMGETAGFVALLKKINPKQLLKKTSKCLCRKHLQYCVKAFMLL